MVEHWKQLDIRRPPMTNLRAEPIHARLFLPYSSMLSTKIVSDLHREIGRHASHTYSLKEPTPTMRLPTF